MKTILTALASLGLLRLSVGMWPFGPEAEAEQSLQRMNYAAPNQNATTIAAETITCPTTTIMRGTATPPPVVVVPPVPPAGTVTQPTIETIAPDPCAVSPYNLSSCTYTNVTMIFRLENTQDEYFAASEFCRARGPGVHCYTPSEQTTTCLPNVMISCPDQVFMRCRDGFFCAAGVDVGGRGAQCRAMIEFVPKAAWNYGTPAMIFSDGMVKGYEVYTTPGSKTAWTPERCFGPYPLPLERCISKVQELMEVCPAATATPTTVAGATPATTVRTKLGMATPPVADECLAPSPIPLPPSLPVTQTTMALTMRKKPRPTKVEIEYGL